MRKVEYNVVWAQWIDRVHSNYFDIWLLQNWGHLSFIVFEAFSDNLRVLAAKRFACLDFLRQT